MYDQARSTIPALVEGNDNALVSAFEHKQLVVNAANHVVTGGHHHREYVLDRIAEGPRAVGVQLVALTEAAQTRRPRLDLARCVAGIWNGNRAPAGKSFTNRSSSPTVLAVSAAARRSSSSSTFRRPSAQCACNASETAARSASEGRASGGAQLTEGWWVDRTGCCSVSSTRTRTLTKPGQRQARLRR